MQGGERYYVTATRQRAETVERRDVYYVVRDLVNSLGGLVPYMPGPNPDRFEHAQSIVNTLLDAKPPLRTLRDLQRMPDNQAYQCWDTTVAQRHDLKVPFQCGCRQWNGAGVVTIEFYSEKEGFKGAYQSSDYADIRKLEPVAGTWRFDDLPSF
jgi:hypothetical protein